MAKIGFIYFSNTDVTAQLIEAACSEAERQGASVFVHRILGAEIVEGRFVHPTLMAQLKACDAIIFGSPTYMGSVSAQFKAFADATSDFWMSQDWAGKLAAGITCGSGLNGDQTATLQYFATLASQHGMLWVGLDAPFCDLQKGVNRLGCHLGVTACSGDGNVDPTDIATAEYLAKRVVALLDR